MCGREARIQAKALAQQQAAEKQSLTASAQK